MRVILKGKIDYVFEDMDEDEDTYDLEDAIEEINENLSETVNDEAYVIQCINDYKDYDGDNTENPLKNIVDLCVDSTYAYLKMDVRDNMSNQNIIDAFKDLLEDLLMESDTRVGIDVFSIVEEPHWNPLTDVESYTSKEVEGYGYVDIAAGVSNCSVEREVA